ncbi:hypothetical protein AALP_AAs53459U000100 [Arabis alpina]|uniref:PGG domain-containing protein n=1 Tax=Arabis alpina TaxID=50452 RepID=A0A087FZQ3_ARAAL|nr:hypothetical protein AALP_AAs53459U000100 [Arabis alpina]
METNTRQGTRRRLQQQSSGYIRYLNRQADWLEKTKAHLLVAASIIANTSAQLMSHPAGGVWQSDKCAFDDPDNRCKGMIGTAVFEYHPSKRGFYSWMIGTSLVSFCASFSLILLAISGFRLRNRLVMGFMIVFMVVAVLCTSAALGFTMVLLHHDDHIINYMLMLYTGFWVCFPLLAILIHIIRSIWWTICFCRRRYLG